MSRRSEINRRELLERLAGLGLATSVLNLGLPSLGQAQADKKRFVTICVPHGVFNQNWLPFVPIDATPSSENPGQNLKAASAYMQRRTFTPRGVNVKEFDLSGITGDISPLFSPKWQKIKSKTLFTRSLGGHCQSTQGHTATAPLCGNKSNANDFSPGESIDVVVARHLKTPFIGFVIPTEPPLTTSYSEIASYFSMSYRKNSSGQPERVPMLANPQKAWDTLFSKIVAEKNAKASSVSVVRSPEERRKVMLDQTLLGYRELLSSSVLSAHDRDRIRSMEGLIAAQVKVVKPSDISDKQIPARHDISKAMPNESYYENKESFLRMQFANAAAAIKANLSKVVSIYGAANGNWTHAFDAIAADGKTSRDKLELAGGDPWHAYSHMLSETTPNDAVRFIKAQRHYFDLIADFLIDLDEVEDTSTGRTYLDNTLVLITFEHSGTPNGHSRETIPTLLVGGGGGFDGGRLLDFSTQQTSSRHGNFNGTSYSRVYMSIFEAFGVPKTTWESSMVIEHDAERNKGTEMTSWDKPLPALKRA
jgi:hypothetical protein